MRRNKCFPCLSVLSFFLCDMCVISFHVLSFPCASCASCHVQVFSILAIAAQTQVSTVLLNTVLVALAVAPAVADF